MKHASPGPLVSVIMSVHNGGAYLREAIRSILDQSFEDFEFIVIDDGSTDGSPEVIETFADSDVRLRPIYQENRGLTRSLNRGIAEARGRLIARMDADDVSLPDRLEKQVAYLNAHADVGIVGGMTRHVNADGVEMGGAWPSWSPPDLNGWRTLFENVLCHPTVVMRRDVLDRLGLGPYHAEILYAQDYELWTRALFETKIANLPDVVLERRKWGGTIGVQHAEGQERTVIKAMKVAHERLLGRSVRSDVVARLRSAVMRHPSSEPMADAATAARELAALHKAYVDLLGSRSASVEDHAAGVLESLARSGEGGRIAPLWVALRRMPRASARRVGRLVTNRLRQP